AWTFRAPSTRPGPSTTYPPSPPRNSKNWANHDYHRSPPDDAHARPDRDGHRGAAAGPSGHGSPPPAGLLGPDSRRHRLHGPRAIRAEHAGRPEARRQVAGGPRQDQRAPQGLDPRGREQSPVSPNAFARAAYPLESPRRLPHGRPGGPAAGDHGNGAVAHLRM